MDDARTNGSEHRDPVITSDGAILMSHSYGGMDLEWASYAILASLYLKRPVEPCEPGCSEMHLLGPGVSFNESDSGILWRWSPDILNDIEDLDSNFHLRVASTGGANVAFKLSQYGIDVRPEGHPSLEILSAVSIDIPEERSGTGVVLHFNHWDRWNFFLKEKGYKVIPSFWNERSRDPLEEVRERLIQIASCERIISTCVAGLGISNACGVPYVYARDANRPISDRVDEKTHDCLPFMELFSYLNKEEPLCLEISDISKVTSDKLEDEMFEKPVQLDPLANNECTISQAIERYRVNFEI